MSVGTTGWRVRPAVAGDLEAIYRLALKTGGGFTNLPPDREALGKRLATSIGCFESDIDAPGGELYLLVLEDAASGEVVGTSALFSKLGTEWPFYSFSISSVTQVSKELGKSLKSDLLILVNDFDGCSEVGGLFIDPARRASGIGRLVARARYLFMAGARARFADKVIADLRGYQAADGRWPFWEGLGRHFFNMDFELADQLNGLKGNQFIADLMPKYPIYVRLLPADAMAAMGKPHPHGERAMALLEEEGFYQDGYVDIFDGGPTMIADVADLKAVRDSRVATVAAVAPLGDAAIDSLASAGGVLDFRAARGLVQATPDGVILAPELARHLDVSLGDKVRHVDF